MSARLSDKRIKLLKELEKLMGVCYNPYSTRMEFFGPDAWDVAEVGREFKYPIRYGNYSNALTGHYKFGANEMYVIENLNRVLQLLEERFGFDIDTPAWLAGVVPGGVLVGEVLEGHAAAAAGMASADVLISAGGKEVNDLNEFRKMCNAVAPGGELPVTVLRDGSRVELLLRRPEVMDDAQVLPAVQK